MALNRGYPPPSLKQIPSKGNVWYVIITKPDELRGGKKNIQTRRSTGTTDERSAKIKQSQIVETIYSEWDELLKRDPFVEFLEENGFSDTTHHQSAAEFVKRFGKVEAAMRLWMKLTNERGQQHPVVDDVFTHLNYQEALEFRSVITPAKDPYPASIQAQNSAALRDFLTELDAEPVYSDPLLCTKQTLIINHTGCRTILDYLPEYMGARKWVKIRQKTKKETETKIKVCANIVGDLPLDQVLANHGVLIAQELDAKGKANSTIKAHINALSLMLGYAVTRLINEKVTPPRPFITANPLKGISLQEYGTQKRSWKPLTEEQLFRLFDQDIPDLDRLLLSILVTTGMRLDEAALLTGKQLKRDRNNIRYFDLSLTAVVKNDRFAARKVAIPDCLILPHLNDGIVFDFPRNADGKASSKASRVLNERYFHPIRTSEDDDRKVVHSLRHNLSGFLLNLSDPAPSAEQLDWITGHGMQGGITESERQKTYSQDPDVKVKYDIVNRIKHPWLSAKTC